MNLHVTRAQQFTREGLTRLFDATDRMRAEFRDAERRKHMHQWLDGTLMHSIFYEASTRTKFSFESGAAHLGMRVVSTENAKVFSSAVKGETLEDSMRVHAGYFPDVIVLRHYEDDAAERAVAVIDAAGFPCHVINAGAGCEQHPTQALLDAYTIDGKFGRLDDLTIIMGGDLKNGRTVRSLSYLLGKYNNIRIIFVSPEQLRIRPDIIEYLIRHKVSYDQTDDVKSVLPEADVVYWTRLQDERIEDRAFAEEMRRVQVASFTIRMEHMKLMKPSAILIHPFPRKGEIAIEVNADPRAYYFRQSDGGLFVRMAVIHSLCKGTQIF